MQASEKVVHRFPGVLEQGDRLARYREELGMNLLVVRPQLQGASEGERLESLERLVEEVWPALSPAPPRPA